ncbi:hypothetical protein DITRI_Ditri11bG0006200 [Diplodiscus trichospermus]
MESTNDTNEVIVEIHGAVASSSRSSSRRFSKVWEDFDIVKEGHTSSKKTKAICKHCGKGYYVASRLGVSHVQRHLEGCSKHPKEAHTQVDQHAYRELVASAIIEHGYSFTWVEHRRNRNIHAFLNKSVETVSRNTIKADCMKLHRKLK